MPHNVTTIIGLYGGIGSGKSVAADFLVKSFNFKRLSFATPIKKGCHELFGFSDHQMNDRLLKETVDPKYNISPRGAFRLIGGGLREQVHPDIWIKRMQDSISEHYLHSSGPIIIDDVRHQNESDFIEGFNHGYVISLKRSDNPFDVHMSSHESDALQLSTKSGTTIYNDAGIEELQVKLLFALNDIGYLDNCIFQKMCNQINAKSNLIRRSENGTRN